MWITQKLLKPKTYVKPWRGNEFANKLEKCKNIHLCLFWVTSKKNSFSTAIKTFLTLTGISYMTIKESLNYYKAKVRYSIRTILCAYILFDLLSTLTERNWSHLTPVPSKTFLASGNLGQTGGSASISFEQAYLKEWSWIKISFNIYTKYY